MQYILIDPIRLMTVPLGLLLQNGNPFAEIALMDTLDHLTGPVPKDIASFAVVCVDRDIAAGRNLLETIVRLKEIGVKRAVLYERAATANRLRLAFSGGASGYFSTSCLTPDLLVAALASTEFCWALEGEIHEPVILPPGKTLNNRLCQTYKAGALDRNTLSYLTGYSGKDLRTALYRAG